MQQNQTIPTTLTTHDFYYDLPEELIAQTPIDPRDHSRLLVYDRATDTIEHKHFYDLPSYLKKGDLLVINNTRVIPARIFGHIENHESVLEVLLLKRKDYTHWETIMKPARKAKLGSVIHFCDELSAVVTEVGDYGARTIEFKFDGVFEDILDRVGNMPLPPYIHEKLADRDRYQTVYAKEEGSAAAPTAGLHFTPALLDAIRAKGVGYGEVTLHVGLGTFRPVKAERIEDHLMHAEHFSITPAVCDEINRRRAAGGRIVAVGTTTCRVLESVADDAGIVHPMTASTQIFIYPGYRFKAIDALITNFHLPESTLLMLVSALAGKEHILNAYREAVKERYRFFSFGDAMLVV